MTRTGKLPEMKPKPEAGRPLEVGDLLDGYTPETAWDEMFAGPDEPRSHYQSLHQVLGTLSRDDFEVRCAARDRAFHDQGITFSHSGEERPFPLDLVPRIIDADEWAVVESGVRQRVLALERFLADVYGPGEILADGVVPRRLVASSSHYHRCVHGLDPAGGVRVHVAGVDLVRDGAGASGCWRTTSAPRRASRTWWRTGGP